MSSHVAITVRILDRTFHGRGDLDEPEWPPSPLRLFQALVASAAREQAGDLTSASRSALLWLENRGAPEIIAPATADTEGYRISVPNNAMDIVARAWSRRSKAEGGDANPATHRAMKAVKPTVLLEEETIHYVWPAEPNEPGSPNGDGHLHTLRRMARTVVALGWGLDLAVGDADSVDASQVAALAGEHWIPRGASAQAGLRIPVSGTLDALLIRYQEFLARIGPHGLTAPRSFSKYVTVAYTLSDSVPPRPFAAFSLLKTDASGFRPFDPARRGLSVAGMTRHAVKSAAEDAGWDAERIGAFVLGHRSDARAGGKHVAVGDRRFAYFALPSIEPRQNGGSSAGSVRRIIISTFSADCDGETAWARRAMSGRELIDETTSRPLAILSLTPASDRILQRYTNPAGDWASVTPVVLPGYDDPAHYRRRLNRPQTAVTQRELILKLEGRIDGLIRKAIVQAGLGETLASHAMLDWSPTGFWPGVDAANRYGIPDHLKRFPRLHVRIQWRNRHGHPVRVAGPLCLGSGRFLGVGLFAAM